MEPETVNFPDLIKEVLTHPSLNLVLRCFLLNEKQQIIHDHKTKNYLQNMPNNKQESIENRDVEIFKNISDAFDTSKKLEEYLGEQQFFTSKLFGGQFTLTIVFIKTESVTWSLGFVCFSEFENDGLLIEIGKELKESVKNVAGKLNN